MMRFDGCAPLPTTRNKVGKGETELPAREMLADMLL